MVPGGGIEPTDTRIFNPKLWMEDQARLRGEISVNIPLRKIKALTGPIVQTICEPGKRLLADGAAAFSVLSSGMIRRR